MPKYIFPFLQVILTLSSEKILKALVNQKDTTPGNVKIFCRDCDKPRNVEVIYFAVFRNGMQKQPL